ncbi:hypothetical protein C2E21_0267 [Chlorella sorokiniana]|jgi:uncharacterized protein (TIGR00296 family)|uniref:AMMECR1 domain-containing protein n=1 Tax=Chlorella sorokiniana TaxID=3076 RepID=A0A2P6U4D9_CHLSO|nr:hypothetical protein C2E21_0267 [Chlorella sorokiniana]|eukprot:PRW61176.1 hypothetical protein C2E21_0267 [Chlorella sorokiniana]
MGGGGSVEPGQLVVAGLPHVLAAWDALHHHLSGSSTPLPALGFEDATCPLFVSWHKASRHGGDSRLRGCIGTLEPRPLHTAVRDYALTSALRDRRFAPIEARELLQLKCTVSLLSGFEAAGGWEDWEIGVHGLVIEFVDPVTGGRRTATFLPEVAAHEGWDKQQTLDHLIRKAGHTGSPVTVRASATLKVTRYQSTTFSLTYDEYQRVKEDEQHGAVKLRRQRQMVAVGAQS